MSIANSPEQISPLLKDAKVPNTALTQVDGTATTLGEIMNNQAAVLIFYRGSW